MLVRIVKDWNFPDIMRQTPLHDGVWAGVRFTEEPVFECDLLIVLNSPNRDISVRCPAGNKWLFTQESPVEQYRWHTESFQYFDKVFSYWDDSLSPAIVHEQTSLPWHVGRSYSELAALRLTDLQQAKKPLVSWVTSNASHKQGHQLRLGFKDYLQQQEFAFDLFGRGFAPIDDKFDAIAPYQYSIAIENYACNDYWTEKIADCFLAWTIPIYWGATNIDRFFPAESMIRIDPADPEAALATVRRAIEENHFEAHLDALTKARELVLDHYQFFPHVVSLLRRYGAAAGTPRLRAFIPAHPQHFLGEGVLGRGKRLIKRKLGWR